MKKKILTGLMMAMVMMSMTACGAAKTESTAADAETETVQSPEESSKLKDLFNEKEDSSRNEETTTEGNTEERVEEEKESENYNEEELKVSDAWEDAQFLMAGEFYALPIKFSVLEEKGWKIDTDVYEDGDVVEPDDTKVVCIYNNNYDEDMSVFVNVTNYGKETSQLSDCVVSNFDIEIDFGGEILENVPELIIAQGITWGSTADDVAEAFGEPDSTYEAKKMNYVSYTYETDNLDSYMEIRINDDFGVAAIEIGTQNEKPSTGLSQETSTSSTHNSYRKKNTDISDDWKDMEFIFDGVKYTLSDADYETMEECGWGFDLADYGHEDGYVLNPNDKVTGTIFLTNPDYDEDMDVMVGFINRSNKIKDIKECGIWSIDVSITFGSKLLDEVPEMTIAQGITWGSTVDEVLEAFGEPESEYRSDSLGYTVYDYTYDYEKYLKIYVFDDYGVTQISMSLYE